MKPGDEIEARRNSAALGGAAESESSEEDFRRCAPSASDCSRKPEAEQGEGTVGGSVETGTRKGTQATTYSASCFAADDPLIRLMTSRARDVTFLLSK